MEANEPIDYRRINAKCACFNLRKATRAVTQYYDHCLEPAGIRVTQFTLLASLASVSARTLTEMANSLVMDRTTLTRNLKPLEKLGLIHTIEARDRRSKAYALTELGKETLNKGVPLWHEAQQKLIQGLGEEQYEKILVEMDSVTKVVGE
ncbi:MAG TPA: MarR family winged helix-turn-helix transcriptional regulator [Gammaproteobacteria bacterium]|nr:MarR family winged helix-turn-helix transcriptional regulator [Gammaproteobacteria bacterium]